MGINNGPNTLAQLFNYNILNVPAFQRAFAWEKPQLRNFIDDLRSHPARDKDINGKTKEYFFGTILLTRAQNISIPLYDSYAVVDGQQRLTTTCIFVAVAAAKLQIDPQYSSLANKFFGQVLQSDEIRKFHTIKEDDGFFERLLLPKGEEVTGNNCDTPSQKKLLDAKQYFEEEIAGFDVALINEMLITLLGAQILVYAVNTNAEATQIFELQNDRGKRLTNLEALKSFLMHGLYLHAGSSTESDLEIVTQNFAHIYRNVEKMEFLYDAPDEDQMLSYHCIAFEKWEKLEDTPEGWRKPKELIRKTLSEAQLNRKEWIKNFSNRLKDTYEFASQILQARDNYSCIPMGELAALNRVALCWPLLLKSWKLDKNQNKPQFTAVVSLLESFTFRSIIAGKRSDTGESKLRELARDFSGDFDALSTELKQMLRGWDIPRSFAFNLDLENFYDWGNTATYLLWRYENHLRSKLGKQNPRLQWDTIVKPMSQAVRYAKDHIEAKDPSNPTLARLVKWDDNDTEARPFADVFLHRLGNLVLDTISTGSAKGKGDFLSRIPHYTANSTFLSQGEIVTTFASRDHDSGELIWDEAAIKKRHKALVEFALNNL